MKDNLYQTEPRKVQEWNSTTSFADTAREVESQDREFALDQIAALAESVKKDYSNE